ncbi:hypothetical protein BDDG_11721 [Blastomyces dermatitidis ATCC 18188]|uniref:Uncharacterized protein n=1 Tax=Ajellomyces dermatitidis (strain ATCC 18188 / CBS 674.68) TaxID=653446 RepID=A0A0J9EK82_AJEDA|nr:hypothetical protein BDDG_11721 [Blastomyces dermatitidis ATCC 18188]
MGSISPSQTDAKGKTPGASSNIEVVPRATQKEVYNRHANHQSNKELSSSSKTGVVLDSTQKEVFHNNHLDSAQKEVSVDPNGASGNIEIANNKPAAYLKFQVEKSTHDPQCNQRRLLPHFITTDMHWEDILSVLPPQFSMYPVSNTGVAEKGTGRIVNFCPRGWQGFTGMKARLDLVENGNAGLPPQRWTISRSGWTRHYKMEEELPAKSAPNSPNPTQFMWKGSMDILGRLDDTAPRCRGNLKLETQDGNTLLAAWKQRRDDRRMGSFTIFEAAKDLISFELIVGSGIAVVMAERASGVNFLGGLGK